MEKIKKYIIQFFKFGIVGVLNTFLSYGIVNGCHYILRLGVQVSNIIAFVISVLSAFLLNGKFVFKSESNESNFTLKKLIKTYVSYSFTGIFLTAFLLHIECDKLNIPLYIASFMNLIITVPINFILNKFFAFGNEKKVDINEVKKYASKHTFAICAYKESEYLEECIKSVINQNIKTNYLIATSTPNSHIENLAKKYGIEYYVRNGKPDIQDDWNFAYNCAKTELVTIAHQDDIYEINYTEEILKNYNEDTNMYNTDYNPYKNGEVVQDINSKIKKKLKFFVKNKTLSKIKFFKVMSLAFGNSINCPSVTYNKRLLGENLFDSELKFALDWDIFLKIAKLKGRSLFIPKKLINYRIHDGATTKEFIIDNKRVAEDTIMFNKFWPKFITKIIMKFYIKSYDIY